MPKRAAPPDPPSARIRIRDDSSPLGVWLRTELDLVNCLPPGRRDEILAADPWLQQAFRETLSFTFHEALSQTFSRGQHAMAAWCRSNRPTRPAKDATRAKMYADRWKQRWGVPFDNDELTVLTSVVPTMAEAKLAQACVTVVAHMSRSEADSLEALVPVFEGRLGAKLQRYLAAFRDLRDELEANPSVADREKLTARWRHQRCMEAVDRAWRWCDARQPKGQGSLWDDLARLIWLQCWDEYDPKHPKRVQALKQARSHWKASQKIG